MRSPLRSKHFIVAGTLFVAVTFLLIFFSEKPTATDSSDDITDSTNNLVIDPAISESELALQGPINFVSEETIVDGSSTGIVPNEQILTRTGKSDELQQITVQKGDTLSEIFDKIGLSQLDLLAIEKACPDGWDFKRIDVDQEMEYQKNDDGELTQFKYHRDKLTSLEFARENDNFISEIIRKEVSYKETFQAVEIAKNEGAISAGLDAGVKKEKTLWRIPKLLQWDIDFYQDIHPGDSYQILYHENYIDGIYDTDGEIIGLIFENRGRTYEIVRYEADEVPAGYFERNGDSTKKRFLRTPVEFTRVSSEFNPKRLHPIHKIVMPHNGIDYAAPTGTPVYATGAGTVSRAGRTKANGNYVVIRHGPIYTTKYLHLHRIDPAMKPGAKVRQGQRIGSVGMTGYATGPHLHYEFLVNGVHKNPRTVELPGGEPMTEEQLKQFRSHADDIFVRMNSMYEKHRESEEPVANN
ncbi:MAG: peptidoglycan DD-metalloendopeptidase family protein [Gammaproteobacteria bacterium]|nr:peptidoglycan DD-metalloendopeptidase family protein [Gammaproteobacteria bacterium]MYK42721.1 peptidoglycan DD-metalloendopeptidase family protein [Gammaproteobacteria bacterium]